MANCEQLPNMCLKQGSDGNPATWGEGRAELGFPEKTTTKPGSVRLGHLSSITQAAKDGVRPVLKPDVRRCSFHKLVSPSAPGDPGKCSVPCKAGTRVNTTAPRKQIVFSDIENCV